MNYFDNISGVKHWVCESSKLRSTYPGGGHMADLIAHKALDNGSIVSRALATSSTVMQAFNSKNATAGEPLYLVLTPPLAYNTALKYYNDEQYFWNAQGEVMRCYEIFPEDIFTISAEAITPAATAPVVGQFVYWDVATGKYIETATAPAAGQADANYLCYCQIVEKVQYKNSVSYRLQVLELNKFVAKA